MSWADSLIKLSGYEVETLQKRLNEIVERRTQAEMKLVLLDAEGVAEAAHARYDAEAGWYQLGYLDGLKVRKANAQAEIDRILLEEAGARDALAQAFEEQKKYEQVARWDVPGLAYPSWAPPVLSRGLLYLRGKDETVREGHKLVCYELIPPKK